MAKTYLITGGAGFFGSILKKELLKSGFNVVSIDLEHDDYERERERERERDGAARTDDEAWITQERNLADLGENLAQNAEFKTNLNENLARNAEFEVNSSENLAKNAKFKANSSENSRSKPYFTAYQGDINDDALMSEIFTKHEISGIFHLAALLAHVKKDLPRLWASNVNGTENVLKFARKFGVKNIVFTSSNCLWAEDFTHPVDENEPPSPIEIYGKSKLEGEKILLAANDVNSTILRCPTIMDEGRLGLLGILFAFIDENRKVWMVGDGTNRYQFIYAKDLADACIKGICRDKSEIFNIGSDDVKSFNEVYEFVIKWGKSRSKIVHLPKFIAIWGMKMCFALGISPLGPYQYKMISANFIFDTSKIKRELGWKPTKTNEQMLLSAYEFYHKNKTEILARKGVSAHNSVAKMGIIRLIKWLS